MKAGATGILTKSENILRSIESLRNTQCSHIGFEILRDHIYDIVHQILRRQEIPDNLPSVIQNLVDVLQPDGQKMLPKEILSLINYFDYQTVAMELDSNIMTYN